MTHVRRSEADDLFARSGDFNEQLYQALRRSPWWLLSAAFHVALALVLSAFVTPQAEARARPPILVSASPDEPLEEELPPEPEPTEPVAPDDLVVPEPVLKDTPDPQNQTDADQPYDEPANPEDTGIADSPFEGPRENGLLGTGPGAGGAFKGRGGPGEGGRRGGAGEKQQDAVLHALRWLAAHQSPEGHWEAAGFDAWCDGKVNAGERPSGPGKAMYDTGVTGLALCAFLGAGYTNRGDHEFAGVVRRGLSWLKNAQDPEGCFGPRGSQHFIYNHATASLAMVEAYGMTESPVFRGAAQKALDFLALARNPYFAWRYGVKPGDNDTSVTGWMMMALKSAKLINDDAARRGRKAPLTFDEDAFDGIRAWIDKMTDPDYGRVGYLARGQVPARPQHLVDRFPAEKSESMTAVGVLARIFLHEDPRKSEPIRKGTELCLRALPTWNTSDGSIDHYYWYYATLAMFQVGGAAWARWDAALQTSVVPNQRLDGTYCASKGSWDPLDPWSEDGGRVYSTALLAMCLEVLHRYDRVAGTR